MTRAPTSTPLHDSAAAQRFSQLRALARERLAEQVPVHLARLRWDGDALAAHRQRALAALLEHAAEHSPFHAERLAHVDLGAVTPQDLTALPVMTKADLMGRWDDVVTDRRLTRAAVEAALAATDDTPHPVAQDYVCLASGGSSGVRGVHAWHWSAVVDYALGMLRGGLARLLEAGGPPPGGVPMAMVTAGSAVHATRALPALLSGDLVRTLPAPATLPFEEIVDRLNAADPVMLQAYPSVLDRLAAARRSGRLRIAPVSVTATSETLPPALRAEVADAFGVPVSDQFGSSEGLVGVSPPGTEGIALADDLAVVELVDADDRPVPDGTPSHAVLVTGLLNTAQPLVRFRIEDRMVRLPSPPGEPWTVVRVEGRSDDVLVFGGRRLHPLVVRTVLVHRADVAEYQVRQTARGIAVDVVPVPGAATDDEGLRDALAAAVGAAGLPDLAVEVRVVASVPRDPVSGKVRRFVPARWTA